MDFRLKADRLASDIISHDLEDCSCIEGRGMKVLTDQLADRLEAFAREAYEAGRKSEAAMWEIQKLGQEFDAAGRRENNGLQR